MKIIHGQSTGIKAAKRTSSCLLFNSIKFLNFFILSFQNQKILPPHEAAEFFHSFVHFDLIRCLKHRLLSPACHRHLENTGGRCYNLNFHLTFQETPLATAMGFAWGSKVCPPMCGPPKTMERQNAEDPHSFFDLYVRVDWITPRNDSVSPLQTMEILDYYLGRNANSYTDPQERQLSI